MIQDRDENLKLPRVSAGNRLVEFRRLDDEGCFDRVVLDGRFVEVGKYPCVLRARSRHEHFDRAPVRVACLAQDIAEMGERGVEDMICAGNIGIHQRGRGERDGVASIDGDGNAAGSRLEVFVQDMQRFAEGRSMCRRQTDEPERRSVEAHADAKPELVAFRHMRAFAHEFADGFIADEIFRVRQCLYFDPRASDKLRLVDAGLSQEIEKRPEITHFDEAGAIGCSRFAAADWMSPQDARPMSTQLRRSVADDVHCGGICQIHWTLAFSRPAPPTGPETCDRRARLQAIQIVRRHS